MVEERLTYRVELDTGQLQADLSMIQSGVGSSLQNLFSMPGQAMGTGSATFNTVNADIMAVRQTAAMTVPAMGLSGGSAQFFPPEAQVGALQAGAMQMGLIGPPPNALFADVMAMQRQSFSDSAFRIGGGMGLKFGVPLLAAGAGAAVGSIFGPAGTMIGGIAGGIAGDAVGGHIYERGMQERQRDLIFRASGMGSEQAGGFASGLKNIRDSASFVGLSEEEITGFATQQAFSGRMGAGGGPEQVKRGIEKFKEDLRSVREIQATLNLAFEEASQVMGAMQGVGLESGPKGGMGAGAEGSVQRILGQTRAMGQFGFNPAQQRQALMESVGVAQMFIQAGADPRIALANAGKGQMAAGQLFRMAQGSDDPLLSTVSRMGTAENVQAAVQRGAGAVGRTPLAEAAMRAALMGTADPEEAAEVAGRLMAGGGRAIAAYQQEQLGSVRGMPAERAALIARSQNQLGSLQEFMKTSPEGRQGMLRGLVSTMDQKLPGFSELDSGKKSEILAQILKEPAGIIKAAMAEMTNLSKEHHKTREEAIDEAVRQIQQNTRKLEGALTNQIRSAVNQFVTAVADTKAVKGAMGFVAKSIKGAARWFSRDASAMEHIDLAEEIVREGGVDLEGKSEEEVTEIIMAQARNIETMVWNSKKDLSPTDIKAAFAEGRSRVGASGNRASARDQILNEELRKILPEYQKQLKQLDPGEGEEDALGRTFMSSKEAGALGNRANEAFNMQANKSLEIIAALRQLIAKIDEDKTPQLETK